MEASNLLIESHTPFAELDLLLWETDREATKDFDDKVAEVERERIDHQILAALVSP